MTTETRPSIGPNRSQNENTLHFSTSSRDLIQPRPITVEARVESLLFGIGQGYKAAETPKILNILEAEEEWVLDVAKDIELDVDLNKINQIVDRIKVVKHK